jgi:hypothetical protein
MSEKAMRLTMRMLDAMNEALSARLAGEIEDVEQPVEEYEKAQAWVQGRVAKRDKRSSDDQRKRNSRRAP